MKSKLNILIWVVFTVLMQGVICASSFSYPFVFKDSSNKKITLNQKPVQVVSLVPSITEIIFKLGAQDSLKGITYHTTNPWDASQKSVVGGFFQPSIEAIDALSPDVIFCSSIHSQVISHFRNSESILVDLKTGSVQDGLETIILLGKIFEKEKQALKIVADIRKDIDLIARKMASANVDKKRVIRLMGRQSIMTPGRDSFQSELIALSGGVPPDFGTGDVVPVSKEDWFKFNPQVIYGCGKDSEAADKFFSLPVWKDVDAVKNSQIFYFPCDLTCRAATHTGDFVKWLSSCIYAKEFGKHESDLTLNRVVSTSPIDAGMDYVQTAAIKESLIHDFVNRSLVINLNRPMKVVSTLEGFKEGITTVGNHYIPPQSWQLNHDQGLDSMKKEILNVLGLRNERSAFLFTGADMNNLSVQTEKFKDLEVKVFATAGVDSNAMRVSKDIGGYYEPGTINIIVMVNYRLTQRAMTRAIIAATEGKTAALLDLDIRSSYGDGRYRATGTGTDNVIVVEGDGKARLDNAHSKVSMDNTHNKASLDNTHSKTNLDNYHNKVSLDNAGGHTKLGELIGRCVYKAVTEAIKKQNGITIDNNIFWRLEKRGITIYSMVGDKQECDCKRPVSDIVADVEALLLDVRFKGFMEMALSLSDDYEKGLIKDLTLFETMCMDVARLIAGKEIQKMKPIITRNDVPTVIAKAINALFNGVYYRSIL
ncbi:MAG: adenosylcobinamide amidohydrolase [Desulfamplus sp.]|nr:adenosylcobinamide amidohydrolase [Desulfamplus sp.]